MKIELPVWTEYLIRIVLCSVICLSSWFSLGIAPVSAASETIIIEWLQFAVPEAAQSDFIAAETEVWDPLNRRSPEYLGKEIWRDPDQPDTLIVFNRWSGREHKNEITSEMVSQTEAQFDAVVGEHYPIVEAHTFMYRP